MLQSFYKYIAEDLLREYFKENHVNKGDRYFIIIENAEYREGLLQALEDISESITLSGIYPQGDSSIVEEPYKTFYFKATDNQPGIIIGYDQTATEDYLTTMRNSIGVKGSKYEDYAVLYILSDRGLSSIVSACVDLQGKNCPLYSKVIIDNISKKAGIKISKDFELMYLKKYLERVANYIADGTSNLFDFQKAMSVLHKGELKGYYQDLDYFPDDTIYESSFTQSDNEMDERITKNQELFHRVDEIMRMDDDVDKVRLLERFLDEKLSKTILSTDDWKKDIPLQKVLNSIEVKQRTSELELLDVKLLNSGLMTRMIHNQKGNRKKTTNSIIICDLSNDNCQQIKLSFNKDIRKYVANDGCRVLGSNVTISVYDNLVRQSVGILDNHHDFIIRKMKLSPSFFKEIENYVQLSKKGEIVVSLPEDCDAVRFGGGIEKVSLPLTRKIDWNDNLTLEILLSEYDEEEKIDFILFVGDQDYKVIVKPAAIKPLLPIGPESMHEPIWDNHQCFSGVPGDGSGFFKIKCGDEERATLRFCRKYLDWENEFIRENSYHLVCKYNSFSGESKIEPSYLNLPDEVKDAIDCIYKYYRDHNTIPSLSYIDDELESLYIKYWVLIRKIISKIPNNRSLDEKEYPITHLGVVEDGDKIYLSPFHPIMVAYLLEYKSVYDGKDKQTCAHNLLTPYYLIPYLSYNDINMCPYGDNEIDRVSTWLCYENADSKPQERVNNITKKMVESKMQQFIKHFNYLFQDKDCPIIISSIGIKDDTNVIIGVVNFIMNEYKNGAVQKIEIHEYVDNLMGETFYEKLNRLNTVDSITREFEKYDVHIESNGEYSSQEIVHQLFTRVTFYKHKLNGTTDDSIGYCHIAFYQMNTGNKFITPNSNDMRLEMSMGGLISIPSTCMNNDSYYIGFGTKGLKVDECGYIYPMAVCLNNLYANEKNKGRSLYHDNTAVVKMFKYTSSSLLESIYSNANWVTFLNPEVDINFFYSQDLYIVHYTDQYTINAKYDSITVTKHIDQYKNMLYKSYQKYALSDERFSYFNKTMMNYFNCLNGSWMLGIVNKTEQQIREKMSVVASCIAMLTFMERTPNILWIPISLEEILRVTGSIGLSKEYIFTKKTLNVKGAMSDDLLMLGLDKSDPDDLKLYMYPVEVKISRSNSFTEKGMKQVSQTYNQLREHIYGEDTFMKKIYRTFFASQFLTNSEKLRANDLITSDFYEEIEKYRYDLLNLKFSLGEVLPNPEMGHAALVSFYASASHSIETVLDGNVAVCQIHFSEKEAFEFVANPNSEHLGFLKNSQINISDAVLNYVMSPELFFDNNYSEDDADDIEMQEILDDNTESDNTPANIQTELETIIDTQNDKIDSIRSATTNDIDFQSPINIIVGNVMGAELKACFEPNNTRKVSHPNLGIIGTMGTGKTQLARSIIAQFSKETQHNVGGKPIGMLVFDYKGDYKDKEFLDVVNGHAYKFNYPFNPLKLVVNDEVEGMNLPAITADRISDSFAKAYGLGLKQQSNIKQVIIETYNEFGITKDSDTWSKTVPTIGNVIDKYFEKYDSNDKAYALFDKLHDYTIFTDDNDSCVSLFEWLDGVRVIDLTLYPDDTKKVIVSLILDLFYAEMRQLGGSIQKNGFREIRAMIMVDEAHQFLKKDFNSLRSIISEGRMFGVGMILSTQNIGDFKTNAEDYTQYVLSWVIHHVNSISKSEITSIFGAGDPNSDKYIKFISNAKLFESICKIGGNVDGIRDLPFFELIKNDKRFGNSNTVELS